MNEERRGPWYLLTGLILGVILGVLYGWVLAPVDYTETQPASLRQDFKQEYIVQIALAYAATGDAARTQARLALFEDPALADTITALAQRALADGRPEQEVRALGQLASAGSSLLENFPTAAPVTQVPTLTPSFTQVPPTATSTHTPTPEPTATLAPSSTLAPSATPTIEGTVVTPVPPTLTFTPLPTPTPTATQPQPYILQTRQLLCDPAIAPPLLVVRTRDAAGNPVPGVGIVVSSPDSPDQHFYTGLKVELGLDYADFTMVPEVRYTLRLMDGSQRITDITPERCTVEGVELWGSVELVFILP